MNEESKRSQLHKMHEQEILVFGDEKVHHCYDSEQLKLSKKAAESSMSFELQSELSKDEKRRQNNIMNQIETLIESPEASVFCNR